jgi:hypothetical protein
MNNADFHLRRRQWLERTLALGAASSTLLAAPSAVTPPGT